MNTLIKNCKIVQVGTDKTGCIDGDILIKDSLIDEIGNPINPDKKKIKIHKKIDAKGKFIIPGFIQSHIHLCQTFFRGQAEDLELLDWLEKKIWPMEASHDARSMEESVRIGLSELIASGTTTVIDMGTAHHTEQIFKVAQDMGVRAYIGNAMMDSGEKLPVRLREKTDEIINKSLGLISKYHGKAKGRLKYILSPRFILSCSDDLFTEIKRISELKDLLIQTHAAENPKEQKAVKEIKGKTEIQYFNDMGILKDNLILAHCVWLEESDMSLIKENNVSVAHCPTVNLKLGSGIAKVHEMSENGINIGIGSDGAPCNNNLNMFSDMKLAGLLQKYQCGVKALPAKRLLEMATINGARALHRDNELGSIEKGKKADLVMLDLNRPNTLPEIDDVYTRIVYSADSKNVSMVMVDGQIIYKKYR